ncbi:MAG: hypothetical protein NTY90_00480 [Candidatus Micrarchaeota archaeon]|nr:hypothetical protein [Candidatus Micrarchaeota archaeon]
MVNENIKREYGGREALKGTFLGPFEYALLAKLERSGKKFFSFRDALNAVPGASRPVLRNTLSKLVTKGRLHRVRKGEYLLVPLKEEDYAMQELVLASHYYPEGYVSFLSALKFYGLTTQLPVVVQVIVVKPARKHVFQETRYEPVRLSKRYYGGYKTIPIAGGEVKMALKEKAILDCLLHPEYCGGMGEVCKAIREAYKALDWKAIAYFLKKMGNSAVERRLYYCLAFLRKKNPLPGKKFVGFRKLDPSMPGRGGYGAKFGLRINADLSEEMR